jgi:hypothetical protein
VSDTELRFGISAPFSGPAKELGQNMKLGIEAAFLPTQMAAYSAASFGSSQQTTVTNPRAPAPP